MERNRTWQWSSILWRAPFSPSASSGLAQTRIAVISNESVRAAWFAFALSRTLVFFVFILSTHLTFIKPAAEFGRDVTEMQIRIRRTSVPDNLRALAMRSDGGWYLGIAQNGYERTAFNHERPHNWHERPHNWAFFPLFPLLVRAAAALTGEFPLTAIALSNVLLLLALFVLHRTVLAFGYFDDTAERATFYTALFPASYFFSLPWTSSLLLLTTTGSFLAARRGRWWLAGACAALASATHYSGIFVFPALVIFYWQTAPHPLRFRTEALGLLLAPLGLVAFALYLQTLTGNALAFAESQAAWGVKLAAFWQPLWGFVSSPFALSEGWNFRLLNFAVAVLAFGCGYVLWQWHDWAWAFYTFLSALVPLSFFTLQARYVAVIFPIFIVLANAGASARVDQIIRTAFAALLCLLTAFYGFFFGIALV